MSKCRSCGHELQDVSVKCPECGSFYSKIAELIAEEEANEEKHSLRGRCKRILSADDIKHELLLEWGQIKAGLTNKAIFTLFVIFAFVFALILTVL
ncbi:MAG: hypothetical protein NTV43_12350 [Methylococcales bacterium]|nr:hypothetical protein [Methylococcales bacterium]